MRDHKKQEDPLQIGEGALGSGQGTERTKTEYV